MYAPQRSVGQTRIPELIEQLKHEYESLMQNLVQTQINELNSMQQAFYDLERTHSRMKDAYEKEIADLKNQLATILSSDASSHAMQTDYRAPPKNLSNSSNKLILPFSATSGIPSGKVADLGPHPVLLPPKDSPSPTPNPSSIASVPNSTRALASALPTSSPSNKPADSSTSTSTASTAASSPSLTPSSSLSKSNANSKPGGESENSDWNIIFNPNVEVAIDADIASTFVHDSVVCSVRFSNDGNYLAVGSNKSVKVYSVPKKNVVCSFDNDLQEALKSQNATMTDDDSEDLYVRSVCFSPDGSQLFAGAEDSTVKVWDFEKRKLIKVLGGHGSDVYSIDCSADGRLIASGSGDQTVKIWDHATWKVMNTLGDDANGPTEGVTSVAVSSDSTRIAAGSLDKIVRIWDTETGSLVGRYTGHTDSVYSVAFAPDGQSLASGALDKELRLWDVKGSSPATACRSRLVGHKDYVLSVTFSPDGNWLVSGSKDRSIRFWDPRASLTYIMLQGHKNSVIAVAFSPDNSHFASGSGDNRARLWKCNSRARQ